MPNDIKWDSDRDLDPSQSSSAFKDLFKQIQAHARSRMGDRITVTPTKSRHNSVIKPLKSEKSLDVTRDPTSSGLNPGNPISEGVERFESRNSWSNSQKESCSSDAKKPKIIFIGTGKSRGIWKKISLEVPSDSIGNSSNSETAPLVGEGKLMNAGNPVRMDSQSSEKLSGNPVPAPSTSHSSSSRGTLPALQLVDITSQGGIYVQSCSSNSNEENSIHLPLCGIIPGETAPSLRGSNMPPEMPGFKEDSFVAHTEEKSSSPKVCGRYLVSPLSECSMHKSEGLPHVPCTTLLPVDQHTGASLRELCFDMDRNKTDVVNSLADTRSVQENSSESVVGCSQNDASEISINLDSPDETSAVNPPSSAQSTQEDNSESLLGRLRDDAFAISRNLDTPEETSSVNPLLSAPSAQENNSELVLRRLQDDASNISRNRGTPEEISAINPFSSIPSANERNNSESVLDCLQDDASGISRNRDTPEGTDSNQMDYTESSIKSAATYLQDNHSDSLDTSKLPDTSEKSCSLTVEPPVLTVETPNSLAVTTRNFGMPPSADKDKYKTLTVVSGSTSKTLRSYPGCLIITSSSCTVLGKPVEEMTPNKCPKSPSELRIVTSECDNSNGVSHKDSELEREKKSVLETTHAKQTQNIDARAKRSPQQPRSSRDIRLTSKADMCLDTTPEVEMHKKQSKNSKICNILSPVTDTACSLDSTIKCHPKDIDNADKSNNRDKGISNSSLGKSILKITQKSAESYIMPRVNARSLWSNVGDNVQPIEVQDDSDDDVIFVSETKPNQAVSFEVRGQRAASKLRNDIIKADNSAARSTAKRQKLDLPTNSQETAKIYNTRYSSSKRFESHKDLSKLAEDSAKFEKEKAKQKQPKVVIQDPKVDDSKVTTVNCTTTTVRTKIKSKRKSIPIKCDFSSKKPRIFLTQKQLRRLPPHILKPVLFERDSAKQSADSLNSAGKQEKSLENESHCTKWKLSPVKTIINLADKAVKDGPSFSGANLTKISSVVFVPKTNRGVKNATIKESHYSTVVTPKSKTGLEISSGSVQCSVQDVCVADVSSKTNPVHASPFGVDKQRVVSTRSDKEPADLCDIQTDTGKATGRVSNADSPSKIHHVHASSYGVEKDKGISSDKEPANLCGIQTDGGKATSRVSNADVPSKIHPAHANSFGVEKDKGISSDKEPANLCGIETDAGKAKSCVLNADAPSKIHPVHTSSFGVEKDIVLSSDKEPGDLCCIETDGGKATMSCVSNADVPSKINHDHASFFGVEKDKGISSDKEPANLCGIETDAGKAKSCVLNAYVPSKIHPVHASSFGVEKDKSRSSDKEPANLCGIETDGGKATSRVSNADVPSKIHPLRASFFGVEKDKGRSSDKEPGDFCGIQTDSGKATGRVSNVDVPSKIHPVHVSSFGVEKDRGVSSDKEPTDLCGIQTGGGEAMSCVWNAGAPSKISSVDVSSFGVKKVEGISSNKEPADFRVIQTGGGKTPGRVCSKTGGNSAKTISSVIVSHKKPVEEVASGVADSNSTADETDTVRMEGELENAKQRIGIKERDKTNERPETTKSVLPPSDQKSVLFPPEIAVEKCEDSGTSSVPDLQHSPTKNGITPPACDKPGKVSTSPSVVLTKLEDNNLRKDYSALTTVSNVQRRSRNPRKRRTNNSVRRRRAKIHNIQNKEEQGRKTKVVAEATSQRTISSENSLRVSSSQALQKVVDIPVINKRRASSKKRMQNIGLTSVNRPISPTGIVKESSVDNASKTADMYFHYAPKLANITMSFDSRVTTCCFCHLPANHLLGLGDLFGPYRPLAEEVLARQDSVNEHLKGSSNGMTAADDPAHAAVGSPQVTFDKDEGTCFLTARAEEDQSTVDGNTVRDITQAVTRTSHRLRTLSTIDHVLQDSGNVSWQKKQKIVEGVSGNPSLRIPGPRNECKLISCETHKAPTPNSKDEGLRPQNDVVLPNINAIVFLEPKIELPHTTETGGMISSSRLPRTPVQRSPRNFDSNLRLKSLNSGRSGCRVSQPMSPVPEIRTQIDGDSTSICISHKFNTSPLWTHGYCALWADGVYAIRGQLYGVWDAARTSSQIMCFLCNRPGATIVTFEDKMAHKTRRVPLKAYHYPCALCAKLKLNWETLTANR